MFNNSQTTPNVGEGMLECAKNLMKSDETVLSVFESIYGKSVTSKCYEEGFFDNSDEIVDGES